MQLKALHLDEKAISSVRLLKGSTGNIMSLRLLSDVILKEHISHQPALLVCVTGRVRYEDQKGRNEVLMAGDYLDIESEIPHWLHAIEESNLLLIK